MSTLTARRDTVIARCARATVIQLRRDRVQQRPLARFLGRRLFACWQDHLERQAVTACVQACDAAIDTWMGLPPARRPPLREHLGLDAQEQHLVTRMPGHLRVIVAARVRAELERSQRLTNTSY
jgi:hypothetical protein